MSPSEARVEVCWTAFRKLSTKDRQVLLGRMVRERELRETLADLLTIETRRDEAERPLSSYLSRRKRARSS